MEVKLTLRRRNEEIAGHEAQVVDTGGELLVLVKLPIPDGMLPSEGADFMQKQAENLLEFADPTKQFLMVPVREGDTCEMGVVSPDVDDLKECIRALPKDARKKLLEELTVDWVELIKEDLEAG